MRTQLRIAVMLLLTASGPLLAQNRIITGKVLDSLSAEVVTSGQVSIQGSTAGTTIHDDGTFTLTAPARAVTLTVRSIGFKRTDVPLATDLNTVEVKLVRDYFQLEAIV